MRKPHRRHKCGMFPRTPLVLRVPLSSSPSHRAPTRRFLFADLFCTSTACRPRPPYRFPPRPVPQTSRCSFPRTGGFYRRPPPPSPSPPPRTAEGAITRGRAIFRRVAGDGRKIKTVRLLFGGGELRGGARACVHDIVIIIVVSALCSYRATHVVLLFCARAFVCTADSRRLTQRPPALFKRFSRPQHARTAVVVRSRAQISRRSNRSIIL